MSKTLEVRALRSYVASICIATGSTDAEAQTVAANLVLANLCGHDSHGVGMVPRYVDAVLEGGLVPNASARTVLDSGTLLTVDGQRGYGQVVGEQAMQLALDRAAQHGSCILALGNAHHLGRIGHFAEMAVARGLVSLHFVNVLARPSVAPWGGGDGRFGTNPCCIGIPLKGREPFLLDFATSRVAQGKMRVAYNQGRTIEPGYLIDAQGRPTTDPGVVVVPQGPDPSRGLFGALMPFGEYKGYGMAVACELLGGALTGGGTWHRPSDAVRAEPAQGSGSAVGGSAHAFAPGLGAPGSRAVVNGMLTILIDPQKLGTQAAFEHEALAFVDWVQSGPVAPGHEAVLLAGAPERAARARRERDGIVIDDTTWAEIEAAGRKVNAKV